MIRQFFAFLFFISIVFNSFAQKLHQGQPNIIFILVDDLGVGDLGIFYQNQRKNEQDRSKPYLQTPYLDKMAQQGAMLTQSYVNAPVCVSSRSSFLTGRTQGHTQVRDNQFDKALDNNYTIASTLKAIGYKTVAIGKWGLQGKGRGKDWPAHPLKRGFDDYFGYIRHGDGHEHYPKEGLYRGTKEVYDNYTNITPVLDKCYTGDLWTARAKQWILDYKKAGNNRQPFFMYLAYDTPHAVLELPTGEYPRGAGAKGGLKWVGKPGYMINSATGKIDSWLAPEYAAATWDHDQNSSTPELPWPDVYKRYATIVKRLDQQVGDLLQLLKDLGLEDNTLVVFGSDNGPSKESYLKEDFSPEFFRGYGGFDGIKRDLWEGGLRTPTLAQWPGKIPGNSKVEVPHMASDWLATFIDAAGTSAPAISDGVSLLPSLTGRGIQQPTTIYMEYAQAERTPNYNDFEPSRRMQKRGQMQAIRLGNYMGVRYNIQSPDDNFEIYDICNDPKETRNLADQKKMSQLQMKMKKKVLQMRRVDTTALRPYDKSLIPPDTDGSVKDNFSRRFYKGTFLWVPTTDGLKPLKESKITSITPDTFTETATGFYKVDAYIIVPEDGTYTFYLNTTGNAVVRLHQVLLIDADYGYKRGEEMVEKIALKAGRHPVTLYYKPAPAPNRSITLQWSGPQLKKTIITL